MPQTPSPITPQTPFAAQEQGIRPRVGLWTLLVSMIVFAFISLLLMFAARVPAISESIHDVLGLPRSSSEDKPDRATHLLMLLFCYTSPLMLMLWISLLKNLLQRRFMSSLNKTPLPPSDPFT